MTPADLDLPLDLEAFDDFPGGSGFQELPPMASSQPPPVTAIPPTITTSQQPQQHTHHYPPQPPIQPQQMVNLQQGQHIIIQVDPWGMTQTICADVYA